MAFRGGSGTTRYFSIDIGPIHWVVLDTDAWSYYRVYNLARAQYVWLTDDLEHVNRTRTPWVIVVTHRPMYDHSPGNGEDDAIRNGIRDDALHVPADVYTLHNLPKPTPALVRHWPLEPLLLKHKVDMWLGGHVHCYRRTWPVAGGEVVQKNYENPTAPVHIMAGNGGCGGLGSCLPPASWDASSKADAIHKPGYARIDAQNATHLSFSLRGQDGAVLDEFVITQKGREL